MNAQHLTSSKKKRRQAMALIMVITTVALISILMVAIFSVTRTEYKATQNFVSARSAKQLADTAVAITEAQIQNAQNTNTGAARTIHATQPGMARVYSADGSFVRAHKLYSSSQMVVTGGVTGTAETALFTPAHQIPTDWKSRPATYVDLNEPVVRPSLGGTIPSVYFPIIDPRAAYNAYGSQTPSSGVSTSQVEGFSYSKSTPAGSGSPVTYAEVVLPTEVGTDSTKLRLPMPVEWIYILQDGTTGAMDASNKFVSSISGVTPSSTNPIVGRVAFWTDDESCKVNVNTASEPTFMASPYFYHARDYKWANFPASSGEYQRYPGHPATVALSAILAPGIKLDPMAPGANVNNIVLTKEAIYSLIPKIAVGGSKAGTLPFVRDEFSSSTGEQNPALIVDAAAARSERLFASVDEMLFEEGAYSLTTGRSSARRDLPGNSGRPMFDHDTLERSRFFLSAHSRSPEFSIHGLPRVAMWPVADEGLGVNRRTSFDNMIALCATLRGSKAGAAIANSYIFRRAQPHHATHDVTGSSSDYGSSQGLSRNSVLLDYLYAQMTGLQYPQISSLGSSGNFGDKYGTQNAAQLAIQFFDYIRSTNLYDGVLARENEGRDGFVNGSDGTTLSGTALYNKGDDKDGTARTYTNHRITRKAEGSLKDGTQTRLGNNILTDNSSVFPGHGQVTPARWTKNSQVYQGFGRMFSISEIGFQIICTADGKNDALPPNGFPVDCGGILSGGGNAPKGDSTVRLLRSGSSAANTPATAFPATFPPGNLTKGYQRWYSNFPPLTDYQSGTRYGCDPTDPNKHPQFHPGYNPANWNLTLPVNTPLKQDEKRVQVMLMLEAFCPMLGWTKIHPEYAIVLDGNFMRSIQLDGQTLFPSTRDVVVKSNGNVYESNDVYSLGGHAGPTAISGGRSVRSFGGTQMGDDTDPYIDSLSARASSPNRYIDNPAGKHDGLNNWGLVSEFVTIKRAGPMQLTFGQRDLQIKIYDKHSRAGSSGNEVQTINLSFDNMTLPVPALVYSGERRSGNQPMTNAANIGELNYFYYVDQFGRDTYRRSTPAPHWWCFNRMGCLGRMFGTVDPSYRGAADQSLYLVGPANVTTFNGLAQQAITGRLDTENRVFTAPGAADNGTRESISIFPPEASSGYTDERGNPWSGSDVVRTYVPAVGDYRISAARNVIPRSMWMPHPLSAGTQGVNAPRNVHTFTTHWGTTESGVDLPANGSNQQLVAGVLYTDQRQPDLPPDPTGGWGRAANSFGDFDNGIANSRDGPWINKPDEGNFYAGNFTRNNRTKYYRSGYFYEPWHNSDDWRSGVYVTPNRLVTSPVMFGSLPTGVWPGGSVSTTALTGSGVNFNEGKPWQTLLFRPYAKSHSTLAKSVNPGHPGDNNPRDHFLLDMFFMPVVEPYAISEPLSVAGRINLNYQIMPFTNITRATGMHALMKGEFITAIPNGDVNNAKTFESSPTTPTEWDRYYNEQTNRKFWHRPINVTETLKQFDEKFNNTATGSNHNAGRFRGLFRSASQICEVHLIPDVSAGISSGGEVLPTSTMTGFTASNRQAAMENFWQNHSPTGDNTRERPYSNLYSRVTTRSNTFRVHMRAQVLRKARSVAVDSFDPNKDAILSEYRGSTLIERYIDPTDISNPLPDYGATTNPLSLPPLETFYKFRTLESKRFSP